MHKESELIKWASQSGHPDKRVSGGLWVLEKLRVVVQEAVDEISVANITPQERRELHTEKFISGMNFVLSKMETICRGGV